MRRLRVRVGDRWYTVEVGDLSARPVRVVVEGEPFEVEVEEDGGVHAVPARRRDAAPSARSPQGAAPLTTSGVTPSEEGLVASPMHGKVVGVVVKPGDRLEPGAEVCLIEAMKMEQTVRVSRGGVVRAVHVQPGQQVRAGDPLLELDLG
mgnify:CR=1 FL=1